MANQDSLETVLGAPSDGVSVLPGTRPEASGVKEVPALVGQRLTLEAFHQLSGTLAGFPFVKVVVERASGRIHFINHAAYSFHADYIGARLLKISREELLAAIDEFNQTVYLSPDREYLLGILALHSSQVSGERRFLTLETVEIDNMDASMLEFFFSTVRAHLDPSIQLLFKPANHLQESIIAGISPQDIPRVYNHELLATRSFVALNPGTVTGRIRAFRSESEYREAFTTLEWYDVIVMHRVPDDIPRMSGIINAEHTTPLSHTNVLASGWQIPNCIQIGIFERIDREGLDGQWVRYSVDMNMTGVSLSKVDRPTELPQQPAWRTTRVTLEEPETANTPILELGSLRMSDRFRYGTKAANLGELRHVLRHGSERVLGFYRIPRPPRATLLPYLAKYLGLDKNAPSAEVARAASRFLLEAIRIPRGIALPFSIQQQFLESSPKIQQQIGKLKMALELNAREVDPICLKLQQMIRATRMPDHLRDLIDAHIAEHLSGVSTFVVRSSSNAEDLENFSAAGIYESINHVASAEKIFDSIKQVWASLVSPRSVRLRQDVGISLDDSYMGTIIQEEVRSEMGGVLVTTNPMNRADFRNVYVNVSTKSPDRVVQGAELPYQYLFNTVEGGGRTLSLGGAKEDLGPEKKAAMQKLAVAGRLLQSHFSPDYTFSTPMDIEWAADSTGIHVLQLRPYVK